MFPEYVEKYNQQQQPLPEPVRADTSPPENSKPLLEKAADPAGDLNEVNGLEERRKERKQALPIWMLLLLVSIFGLVMALPLLQL